MRRADRPGAQHDLVGLEGDGLATDAGLDGRRPAPVELDALDLALGLDRQVGAVTGGIQVPDVGALTVAVEVVGRQWSDAGGVGGVMVGGLLVALLAAGL